MQNVSIFNSANLRSRVLLFNIPGISTNLLFVAFVCALSWYHLQAEDPSEEEARRAGFDSSEAFGDGTEKYIFDSEELAESLSIKEETKDDGMVMS